jgi:hypothetical protein
MRRTDPYRRMRWLVFTLTIATTAAIMILAGAFLLRVVR